MKLVPDPTFAQPERRSYLIPILVAIAALAVALVVATHFFPATTVNIAHVHTDVLPTHTVYKTDSTVVGQDPAENILYVAETLTIDNQLRRPIDLDDFTLTFINAQGAQLTQRAVEKADLPNLELSFPALRPLLTQPLLRETSIDPGKQATGTLLFALQVPQQMYDTRQSAVIKVDLYHLNPIYQIIPLNASH